MPRMIICKDCGEEKEHQAKGLCNACYKRKRYKENKSLVLQQNRKWNEENREAMLAYKRQWHKENPGSHGTNTDLDQLLDSYLKRKYGIGLIQYNEVLESQGGVCGICGKTAAENGRRLGVDHDHETGENRGILCDGCNKGIGFLQDNPGLCIAAADYLMKVESKYTVKDKV